jgi:hypothetical protein
MQSGCNPISKTFPCLDKDVLKKGCEFIFYSELRFCKEVLLDTNKKIKNGVRWFVKTIEPKKNVFLRIKLRLIRAGAKVQVYILYLHLVPVPNAYE